MVFSLLFLGWNARMKFRPGHPAGVAHGICHVVEMRQTAILRTEVAEAPPGGPGQWGEWAHESGEAERKIRTLMTFKHARPFGKVISPTARFS